MAGLYYTSQEFILSKIHVNKMNMLFSEGIWGFLICGIFTAGLNYTNPKQEDTVAWFYQLQKEPIEIVLHVVYSVCTMMSSAAGISISGNLSSAARATIDACRIILIWLVSFALKWETWSNVVTPLRILGFALIILGVLVYNDVFKIIPYLRKQNIESFGKWMGRKTVKQEKNLIIMDDTKAEVEGLTPGNGKDVVNAEVRTEADTLEIAVL